MLSNVEVLVTLACMSLQVLSRILLSLAMSNRMVQSSFGAFIVILDIYRTETVGQTVPVSIWMRFVAGIMSSLGAVVAGGRLMPVTGVLSACDLSQLSMFQQAIFLKSSHVSSNRKHGGRYPKSSYIL